MSDRPKTRVLFVCTHNSARSILAEGLLRQVGGDRFDVRSGGTEPGQVHPLAIQVLRDAGIDPSFAASKALTQFLDEPFDVVITLCDDARQACPIFPGSGRSLHWGYDDPSAVEGTEAERLEAFRRVFASLGIRIRQFAGLAEREPEGIRAAGRH